MFWRVLSHLSVVLLFPEAGESVLTQLCGSAPALSQGFCLGHFFAKGHHGLRCCFASAGTKEATTTLHVLALLRDLLPCFPAAVVKTCCETLLRVMTLSHVVSVPALRMGRAAHFSLGVVWKGSNPVGCWLGAWK